MGRTVELPDVHNVAFILQNSRFVIIHVEIIGSGENGHDGGKTGCLGLAIHAISASVIQKAGESSRKRLLPRILSLVCSYNRQQIVAFKEVACSLVSVREGNQNGQQVDDQDTEVGRT
jgi:hypothetical protein